MTKDKPYFIGLILLISAFIASVISFYLIVFTWAIYLIGVIFILYSSQKIGAKLLLILAPILLYIPASFLFLYLYNYTSPKILIAPENYKGKTLRIIYDENCGEKYGLEDGKKVLKFPPDGILILNEKFDGKSNSNDIHYFIKENGKRIKTNHYKLNSGGSASLDYLTKEDDTTDYTFVDYTFKNHEYDFKTEQKFDSISGAKVKSCRKK